MSVNQLVLNCERISFVRPFTHDVITQNTTHRNIMYLYRSHSASTSLGQGRESTKKATNDIKRRTGSQKSGDVPHTNSSM